MHYIFLLIALLAGATKGYCGKKTSGYTKSLGDAVLANTIRMVLCIIIGLIIVLASDGPSALVTDSKTLLISALSGISTAIFVVSWLICVRSNAYMLLEIFLMLGVLVPLLASNLFFREDIKLTQWAGILVLFVAVLFMNSYNNTLRKKISLRAFLLLLLCGTASGVSDFSQKLFTKLTESGSTAVFQFYTYIFASAILFIALAITSKTGSRPNVSNGKKILFPVVVMAICLFLHSFFKTLAAKQLDAIILYPLSQGCALILSSLMASLLFKEKLNFKAITGIITAFIGLLIINLL